MGQDRTYEGLLPVEVDGGNQPELVSAEIEHVQVANLVDPWEQPAQSGYAWSPVSWGRVSRMVRSMKYKVRIDCGGAFAKRLNRASDPRPGSGRT